MTFIGLTLQNYTSQDSRKHNDSDVGLKVSHKQYDERWTSYPLDHRHDVVLFTKALLKLIFEL